MDKNTSILVGAILIVAIVSAFISYWRAESFSTTGDLETKTLSVLRREKVIFFATWLPIVVGVISFYVYRRLYNHNPDSAQADIMLMAVLIGLGFTILAGVVFKMRGFNEFFALHVLYVASFGWFMPHFVAF